MNIARLNRWLLLTALLIGAGLRLWQLDTLPLGLYHDEAYNGLDALALNEGGEFPIFHEAWELYAADAHADNPAVPTRFPLFFEGNYGREPVHIYLMSLSVRLLGNTVLAVRLVPALAGILAIWTTWLAASALVAADGSSQKQRQKQRFESLAPGAAALALAIIFPAVHFSRFGLRVMLFAPVATLTVYHFWRGIRAVEENRSGSWRHWLPAGFWLGFGLYVYAAARLFPLLFIVFVAVWFLLDRSAWRRFWRPLLMMATAALITAAPLLWFFLRYPYFFFFRIAFVANRGKGAIEGHPLQTWLTNLPRVIGGLFWAGESHFRHNLPGRPFLDGLQALFFALGVVKAGGKLRRPVMAFLILWLGVMLLPSVLSGDAPHFGRMTGALPPIAILIGLGVEAVYRRFAGRRFAALGLALLLVASVLWTGYDYFGRYAGHAAMQTDFYKTDWQLGQALAAAPGSPDLYFSPTQEEMATIFYALGSERGRLRSVNLDQTLIAAGTPQHPVLYAVHERVPLALKHLQDYFPEGEISGHTGPYTLFSVGEEIDRLPPGLNLSGENFGGQIELVGWTAVPREDLLEITLVWRSLSQIPTGSTAFVHLLDQEGEIIAQLDRPPAGYATNDWRPGEIIIDRFDIAWPGEPPKNWGLRTGFYETAAQQPLGEPILLPTR